MILWFAYRHHIIMATFTRSGGLIVRERNCKRAPCGFAMASVTCIGSRGVIGNFADYTVVIVASHTFGVRLIMRKRRNGRQPNSGQMASFAGVGGTGMLYGGFISQARPGGVASRVITSLSGDSTVVKEGNQPACNCMTLITRQVRFYVIRTLATGYRTYIVAIFTCIRGLIMGKRCDQRHPEVRIVACLALIRRNRMVDALPGLLHAIVAFNAGLRAYGTVIECGCRCHQEAGRCVTRIAGGAGFDMVRRLPWSKYVVMAKFTLGGQLFEYGTNVAAFAVYARVLAGQREARGQVVKGGKVFDLGS
jgi:hypothetical protein